MTPVCPANYECTFTPNRPPTYDVWWQGPWGIVAAILALAVLAGLLAWGAFLLAEWAANRREHRAEQEKCASGERLERERRQHVLDVEQQRTMQLDAAKGDAEVLRLVRDMQRTAS